MTCSCRAWRGAGPDSVSFPGDVAGGAASVAGLFPCPPVAAGPSFQLRHGVSSRPLRSEPGTHQVGVQEERHSVVHLPRCVLSLDLDGVPSEFGTQSTLCIFWNPVVLDRTEKPFRELVLRTEIPLVFRANKSYIRSFSEPKVFKKQSFGFSGSWDRR